MGVLQQYKIGAGWNVASGSLVNIESIIPSNDRAFFSVAAIGFYSPGQEHTVGDGSAFFGGYPVVIWTWSVLTRAQLLYLQTTYCSGGWSGKVTINTTLGGTAFSRMNAYMRLTTPDQSQGEFFAERRYQARMTRLATAV